MKYKLLITCLFLVFALAVSAVAIANDSDEVIAEPVEDMLVTSEQHCLGMAVEEGVLEDDMQDYIEDCVEEMTADASEAEIENVASEME